VLLRRRMDPAEAEAAEAAEEEEEEAAAEAECCRSQTCASPFVMGAGARWRVIRRYRT
jgi:hypothetical protein